MLTPKQIAERKLGIGASEAARILSGDWFPLWQIKTGRAEEDDLSGVFAVQLGQATEHLNLDWMERQENVRIEHRGATIVSPDHGFLRCTLDGFTTYQGKPTVVEAKHCGPWQKLEEVIDRYTPQVMHQMICTRAPQAVLSIIFGTNEPVRQVIQFDEFFANEYIERAREFWSYVERDKEPPHAEPMAAPVVALDDMREVDMASSNSWAEHAAIWLANGAAAKRFTGAVDDLKKLIEPDVKRAFGHGIEAKRTKKGISIKAL